MIIYFLRHGLAADRAEWTGDDALRPLTPQGRKRTEQAAVRLAALNLGIQLVITSPLVRARQTAELTAKELGLQDRLVEDRRLGPGFDLLALEAILQDHADVDTFMVVGHEPDFSETVSACTGGSRLVFKKGGLARVDITSLAPLQGEITWLVSPRLLIG